MNKNVNRDYLVKVNVKTAEIETPKDDMIFYVTDIWTSNIFFQLDFGKGNSLTDLHNENASDYDLTLYTCTKDGLRRVTVRCNRI